MTVGRIFPTVKAMDDGITTEGFLTSADVQYRCDTHKDSYNDWSISSLVKIPETTLLPSIMAMSQKIKYFQVVRVSAHTLFGSLVPSPLSHG